MNNDTPLKSIRKRCLKCCAGSTKEVKICHLEQCTLWDYRFGRRPAKSNNGKLALPVMKAIKVYCLDCSGYIKSERRNCDIPECHLYKFRMGKNPNKKNNKGNVDALKKYHMSSKT